MGAGMQTRVAQGARADEFSRLHRLFLEHYGIAVWLTWIVAALAATQAPWLRNIRGLIDPAGRPESTLSFLFSLPALMTLSWLLVACCGDVIRRSQVLRSQALEFGIAGAVAFGVVCLALHRAVSVLLVAW
jgi:hypothetical protein